MGCDGGTIPTRDELVKLKKKPEQKDRDSVRAYKWKHCSLTQEPLRQPIVACQLGRLYNKEAVIEFLLDRAKFEGVAGFYYIKGLKDVKSLELTNNPAYRDPEGDKGGVYIDRNTAPYICPISGLEMNGKYRFSYLRDCGCVFAERALKEIKTETCNKCGKPYLQSDVIILNGTEEDVDELRERMEQRKLRAKLEKKSRKRTAVTETSVTETGATETAVEETLQADGPSTSKLKKPDDQTASKLTTDVTAAKSKLTNGMPSAKEAGSKLAIGKAGDKKKPVSVQDDPQASSAYKSLFTTHKTCIDQQKAHWVTHNPCYY